MPGEWSITYLLEAKTMVSRCLLFHNDVIQASCLPFTLQDVRSCMHLLTLTGFRDTACCYKQPDVFCGVLSCSSSSDNATLKQPVRLCTTRALLYLCRCLPIHFITSLLALFAAGQNQANTTLPDYNSVQLILQNSTGYATCSLAIGKYCSPNPDGTCTATSRFQNAPSNLNESSMDCQPFLSSAAAIGFQTLQDNLTLCIGGLQRLPSTVVAEGEPL